MDDCHIETWRENGLVGLVRAAVIETATGSQVYVTWPYGSEESARRAAGRWMDEERQRRQGRPERKLFAL